MEIYIWRDKVDSETFHIGTKNRAGYTIHASMFTDSVYYIFNLTDSQFKLIGEEPIEIELTLEILPFVSK